MARETFPLTPSLHKQDRLLIISPHCDDETLGAGGTMAAARKTGAAVMVVFLTNGDGSGSTRIVQQATDIETSVKSLARSQTWRELVAPRNGKDSSKKTAKNLFQRIADRRQKEALAACQVLGVKGEDVLFLGYPDGGTRAMWETNWANTNPYFSAYTKTSNSPYANSLTPNAPYSGAQLTEDLQKIILQFRPTVVLTTHPEDTHADHWASYAYTAAAIEALRLSPQRSVATQARQIQLRTFLVHHGIWPAPHGYHPYAELVPPASLKDCGTHWSVEPVSVRHRDAKKAALDCYVSQLVFTPLYLRSFIRKNELFGQIPVLTASLAKDMATHAKHLQKDGPSDSLWRERWPAADIRSLEVFSNGSQSLTLRCDLGRKPSTRLQYRFSLHAIDAAGTHAVQIEAKTGTSGVQTTLTDLQNSGSPRSIAGKVITNGLEVTVPLDDLHLSKTKRSTLLVSASTLTKRTRLDQTATAIIRLEPARVESP